MQRRLFSKTRTSNSSATKIMYLASGATGFAASAKTLSEFRSDQEKQRMLGVVPVTCLFASLATRGFAPALARSTFSFGSGFALPVANAVLKFDNENFNKVEKAAADCASEAINQMKSN